MRVFVTGLGGFVGRWLAQELQAAGHEVTGPAGQHELDITDRASLQAALRDAAPDAVAHLAAVAYAPDAREDPARAFATNVGGTVNLLESVRGLEVEPVLLVTSSSEVYGVPDPGELPLRESSPLAPRSPYALSKVAEESVALAYAARQGWRLVVVRAFNHSGPGQRPQFVVPALARRVAAVRSGDEPLIRVGNVDVRRDFTDVRDVVRAYRLLLEGASSTDVPATGGAIYNVCSGRTVAIRWIVEQLCRLAGIPARLAIDPDLVRSVDAPEVRGDASRLATAVGWRPERRLEQMLADVWADLQETGTPVAGGSTADG